MDFDSIGANRSEKAAIHDFFIHATLPILIQEGDRFGTIATGTLFKILEPVVSESPLPIPWKAIDSWAFQHIRVRERSRQSVGPIT